MSQHDFDISNQSFPATRSDLNNAMKALASLSSGSSAPSSPTQYQLWLDTTATLMILKFYDGADWIPMIQIDGVSNNATPFASSDHGQCKLYKYGSNLFFGPYNGNKIMIGGQLRTIPSTGITLSQSALSSNTLYYIYAYMGGTLMMLESSTTVHAGDTATGVEIKNGDPSRTLVGMAYTSAATAWVDTPQQRFVRTWFNRRPVPLIGTFSVNRSTSSTTYVEMNSEIRCEFLIWQEEMLDAEYNGGGTHSVSGGYGGYAVSLNGATSIPANEQNFGANNGVLENRVSFGMSRTGLTEGYNYATVVGLTASGGSITLVGSGTGANNNGITRGGSLRIKLS